MTFKAQLLHFAVILLALTAGPRIAAAEPLQLVGLGDSLMAGYQLPQEDALPAQLQRQLVAKGHDVVIANAGVSGDTTSGGLSRVDWSVPDGTDGVILELGANDALRGLPPEQTEKNLDQIITRLKERNIRSCSSACWPHPIWAMTTARSSTGFTRVSQKNTVSRFIPLCLKA